MLTLIIILLIGLLVLILGVITYTSSTDKSAKFFGILSMLISLWIFSNFLGGNDLVGFELRSLLTYLDFALGVLMSSVFLIFASSIAENNKLLKAGMFVVLPLSILFALLTLLGFVVDVQIIDGEIAVSEKYMFIFYNILVILSALLGTVVLVRGYLSSVAENRKKLKLIVWGLSTAVVVAIFANLLYPLVVSERENRLLVSYASYVSVLLFTIFTWRAISKHKLFNLRDAAARSFAYFASIGSLLLVYVTTILVLSGSEVLSSNITTFQRIVFALIAILSGLLFQPFKQFFDKVTNKIFYRDSYDAQVLIDELNKNLVNSVELEELLTKSALIIQENLKVQFTTFFIRETSYFPDRIIGAHRKDPEIEDLDRMQEIAPKIRKKVLYVGDNGDSEQEKELSQILQRNDIEVVARLVNTLDFEVKGIGYLLIGAKKSGSDYTKQDLKVIEIVANELVIATENALRLEEIEQFNVTLQKKIDDATKELKQTNQKLLALDEAKDEFVSMASHQLRTPLTSIKGYLSMVLEGDAGKINDTQKEMLGQAFFSSQRMVYLIADLLNVSRLKTGKFTIETKPVYLPDVVESEISQLQEGAAAKNLKLTFDKPQSFPTLNLDEMKIRQVVMNFSDNAIYYTPSGGKITVELKETPKAVEFRVKDSGIGVPKDEQHKLFTKFYRAENARKTRPDGTGLGIFMAKKVIVAQGGSIIFESKEGKGSTFGFSFPKEKLQVNNSDKTQDS